MKNPTTFFVFLILMTACVKQADWPLPGVPLDLIAVEALLTDEQKVHIVTLSRPVTELNAEPEPVAGAIVLLSTSDSLWSLEEDTLRPGSYLTGPGFVAVPGIEYTLEITWQEKFFSAKSYMVPGKVFNELVYKRNDTGDLYHIDWVASAFSTDDPGMWEIIIDWSSLPGFDTLDPASSSARMLFYTLTTIDVSQIFAPVMEQTSFPAGSLITERRYSLTPGHAEYCRQLLLETNWQGGFFPTANANVTTNLSPGAIGYFGVCAVNELSLVVE